MTLADPTIKKTGANSYDVSYGSDEGLYVEFENVPVHQAFASEEQGRPIYKDETFIRIMFPGDRTKTVFRPINDIDKQRFDRQYKSYVETGLVVNEGTPLEQWAPLSKSEVAELKGLKIHTVEALASLPDSALTWLGSRQYRDKAVLWLDNAKGGEAVMKLKAENETLKSDIEMMKKQIQELGSIKSKKDKE